MTKERELELGRIIRNYKDNNIGTKEEADKAFNELFEANKDMATSMASKIYKSSNCQHYDYEDLQQDSLMALVSVIWDYYDPSKDCRVSTIAYWHILKTCSKAINSSRQVFVPDKEMGDWLNILRAKKKVLEEHPAYTLEQQFRAIAKQTKYSYEYIMSLNEVINFHQSLNEEVRGDDGSSREFIDIIANKEKQQADYSEVITKLFKKLTEQEIDLITSKYNMSQLTPEEAMAKYNMTNRGYAIKVSNIEKKLRATFGNAQ